MTGRRAEASKWGAPVRTTGFRTRRKGLAEDSRAAGADVESGNTPRREFSRVRTAFEDVSRARQIRVSLAIGSNRVPKIGDRFFRTSRSPDARPRGDPGRGRVSRSSEASRHPPSLVRIPPSWQSRPLGLGTSCARALAARRSQCARCAASTSRGRPRGAVDSARSTEPEQRRAPDHPPELDSSPGTPSGSGRRRLWGRPGKDKLRVCGFQDSGVLRHKGSARAPQVGIWDRDVRRPGAPAGSRESWKSNFQLAALVPRVREVRIEGSHSVKPGDRHFFRVGGAGPQVVLEIIRLSGGSRFAERAACVRSGGAQRSFSGSWGVTTGR